MHVHRFRLLTGLALAAGCMPALATNITPDLQFNGYATAGVAWTHNAQGANYVENAPTTTGITNVPTLDNDSVIGLQLNYRVNENTHLVTQLLGSQTNGDYTFKASQAYIAYTLGDELTLRGGRLPVPTFLYSENLNVGEAWPWARLPTEVYGSLDGFQSVNGLELVWNHPLGNWNLSVLPLLGNSSLSNEQTTKIASINVNLSSDNLTLHAGSEHSDVSIDFSDSTAGQAFFNGVNAGMERNGVPVATIQDTDAALAGALNLQNITSTYNDAGALYDDGDWFGALEYSQVRVHAWPQNFNAGYISAGHYFGKLLPYVLYSRLNDVEEQKSHEDYPASLSAFTDPLYQAQRKDQQTWALGARYEIRPGTSFKAQVDRITGFSGTNGLFTPSGATPLNLSTVYVYSFSINTSF